MNQAIRCLYKSRGFRLPKDSMQSRAIACAHLAAKVICEDHYTVIQSLHSLRLHLAENRTTEPIILTYDLTNHMDMVSPAKFTEAKVAVAKANKAEERVDVLSGEIAVIMEKYRNAVKETNVKRFRATNLTQELTLNRDQVVGRQRGIMGRNRIIIVAYYLLFSLCCWQIVRDRQHCWIEHC
jgi:hypothetical protein